MSFKFYIWPAFTLPSQPRAFSSHNPSLFPPQNSIQHSLWHPNSANRSQIAALPACAQLCSICGLSATRSCLSCDRAFCHPHLYACNDCETFLCGSCLDLHNLDGHWSDSDTTAALNSARRLARNLHAAVPPRHIRRPLASAHRTAIASETQSQIAAADAQTNAQIHPSAAANTTQSHGQVASHSTISPHPASDFFLSAFQANVNRSQPSTTSHNSPADTHIIPSSTATSPSLYSPISSPISPYSAASATINSRRSGRRSCAVLYSLASQIAGFFTLQAAISPLQGCA
jgi:hypothetical protein